MTKEHSMHLVSGEFAPYFAPFEMSHHQSLSETAELIKDKGFDVLSNLEPQFEYGHFTVADFTDDLIGEIHTNKENVGILQIIGESASGKSFAASQWAELLHEKNITPCYIPWVDVIRDAKKLGHIGHDTKFGQLSPEEFNSVTELYLDITNAVLTKHKETSMENPLCVIGEVVGTPAIDAEGNYLNRGTTAIRKLVTENNAYVAALYGSPQMRETGKRFRKEFFSLQNGDDVPEILQKFGIRTQEHDISKIQHSLQESGAPLGAVETIENQIDRELILLAETGYINLPKKKRTIEYLREHPQSRTNLIGKQLLPFILEEELFVKEDHALLCLNKKISKRSITRFTVDAVHYHSYLQE